MKHHQRLVLVIDDDPETVSEFKAFLKFLGYQPLVAESAGDGLDIARACAPECVICAIGLPGMNGFALARSLRDDPRTASAWLIGLSDFSGSAFEDLGGKSCFDRFLFRPVCIRTLRESLAISVAV